MASSQWIYPNPSLQSIFVEDLRSDSKYLARHVKPEELFPGCIVWLPQRFQGDESMYCAIHENCDEVDPNTNHTIRAGMYKHPVVVLRTWQRPGSQVYGDLMVLFTDVTSFDSTPLHMHTNLQHLIKFATSTPIRHTSPQINDPFMLELSSDSITLKEQCYVRRQHAWVIPARQLWNYWWHGSHAYSARLSQESYYWITSQLGITTEIYEDTPTSLFRSAERLMWLVAEEQRKLAESMSNWNSRDIWQQDHFAQAPYTCPFYPQQILRTSFFPDSAVSTYQADENFPHKWTATNNLNAQSWTSYSTNNQQTHPNTQNSGNKWNRWTRKSI